MENDFGKVMAGHSDTELIKIVTGPPDNYQPAAFVAAQKEYARRNLSESQIESAETEIKKEEAEKVELANIPLNAGLKTFAFLFPGLIYLIFIGLLRSEGQLRKAKDLGRWTLYGIGFYILLFIAIMIYVGTVLA